MIMHEILFDFIGKYIALTDEERQAIIALDIFRSFKKGAILLREGALSRHSYFVLKGCLRSYYLIDGEERTTDFYTETQGFTPACATTQQPSEHYVSCVEDTIALVSVPEMEQVIFERFPRFESLCRMLADELLIENRKAFADFKNASPEQRYLGLLESRRDLVQRVPQHQLASYLGIKPESLSRIRRRLAGQKQA